MNELKEYLDKNGYKEETVCETISILKRKFLISEGAFNNEDRHSRSLLFYSLSGAEIDKIQETLSSKKVAIVGCGGIGNVISVLLSTAGIGEFILVDNDQIELSNLSRQFMFKESDCGLSKTQVLEQALRERASNVKITLINEFLTNKNVELLKTVDFILLSGDQDHLLNLINAFAIQNRIPFLNVGYVEDIAVWGPLVIPGKTGCYECQQHLVSFSELSQTQFDQCKEINASYQAPSSGPINMIAASFAALDIIKFFGLFGDIQSLNTRLGIWSHNLHIEKQDYSLNSSCPICSSIQKTT